MVKIYQRYVSSELFLPFMGGVGVFGVILIGNLIFTLINPLAQGIISFSDLWRLILYKIPSFLSLSFPPAMLFGSAFATARLTREGETTAMRMAGLPMWKIFLPFLLAGIIASGFSFLLNDRLAPIGNRKAQEIFQRVWFSQPTPIPQERVFFRSGNYAFYIERVDKRNEEVILNNVFILEMSGGRFPNLYTAPWGKCGWDQKQWELYEGILHQLDVRGFVRQEMKFDKAVISLTTPLQNAWISSKTPEEMSTKELLREIKTWQQSGVRELRILFMEYHTKLAIPFACLIVALLAPPFAYRFARRSGAMGGFLIALLLFFIYYNGYLLFRMLGTNGVLPPYLAAWGPNLAFGALGVFLFFKEW